MVCCRDLPLRRPLCRLSRHAAGIGVNSRCGLLQRFTSPSSSVSAVSPRCWDRNEFQMWSVAEIYLSVVLCVGCLATLLTMAVLHIHKRPSSKPVHPALRKLATKFLIPFRDFTYCGCARRKKTENRTDAANTTLRHGRNSASKVVPEIGTRLSGGEEIDRGSQTESSDLTELKGAQPVAREDNRGDFRCYKVDEYGSESGSCNNSGREETPTVSWQELASLFDHLFLYAFSFVLVTLTVVVLSLLYACY